MDGLLEFLRTALKYAWPDHIQPSSKPDLPGFHETHYRDGAWRYLDLWSGSLTDMGLMVAFHDEKAVWGASYRGGILRAGKPERGDIYAFLADVLRQPNDQRFPLRGPEAFRSGDWHYRFAISGDYTSFSAAEDVLYQDALVMQRVFSGGMFGNDNFYGSPVALFSNLFAPTSSDSS